MIGEKDNVPGAETLILDPGGNWIIVDFVYCVTAPPTTSACCASGLLKEKPRPLRCA